ncbi:MAG: hypothetical protein EOO75_01155 [Myxococcales bacterium]|nr:MAG: hypothetical protein EOO75_01155 [Myxococcales bacterium]
MTGLGPDARAVRAALIDARALCAALGLLDGYRPGRQRDGVVIRCPAHRDQTPSCSVRRAADGTLSASCFACGWSGDALHLVALARGLDLRADFPAVVEAAVEITGGGVFSSSSEPRSFAPALVSYPPASEVSDLWRAAGPVEQDDAAAAYLRSRALDTGLLDLYELARVLPAGAPCPRWARVRGLAWSVSGHRLLVPMVDATGTMQSLRAWALPGEQQLVEGEELPKRVAPAGHSVTGLVMACPVARRMLETGEAPAYLDGAPLDVVIVEGEPDFATWASGVSDASKAPPAVLGVVASAWSQAVADRVPEGSRVIIRTHRDAAGDRYAAAIRESLNERLVAVFDFNRTGRRHGQAA